MEYKLVLANGNVVTVESENTLEEMANEICECKWISDKKSGSLVFSRFIVWIEEQSNE